MLSSFCEQSLQGVWHDSLRFSNHSVVRTAYVQYIASYYRCLVACFAGRFAVRRIKHVILFDDDGG